MKALLPILFVLIIAAPVFAQDACTEDQICNPLRYDTFEALLDAIATFLFWVGMAIAPVLLIIAGFYFVTSGGNPEKFKTGKNIVIYTIIGVVIMLFASGLIKVLQSVLGVQTQ